MSELEHLDWSVVADPHHYARNGVPFEVFDVMRRTAGLTLVQPKKVAPIWAVTRYDDIKYVSRQQELFHNSPRMVIEADPNSTGIPGFENLLDMDPPKHGIYRKVLAAYFTVNSIRSKSAVVDRYADRAFAALLEKAKSGQSFDLVRNVAFVVPTYTICALIGIPEECAERVTGWVHQISAAPAQDEPIEARTKRMADTFLGEVVPFFSDLLKQRRKGPQDDFITALAQNANPKLSDTEIIAYCILLMAGGDDTTREAFCGGVLALARHPNELVRLQDDPTLLKSAIEEILRWTSPINHFCRNATKDSEVAGTKVLHCSTRPATEMSASSRIPIPSRSIASRTCTLLLVSGGTCVLVQISPVSNFSGYWSELYLGSTVSPSTLPRPRMRRS